MMTHRTTAILLAVSVALNLFFLGVATSWAWRGRHEHARERGAAVERRSPPKADASSWLTESERDELRPRRKALRALRREAEGLLRAESFEPEKFRGSLSALRTETDAVQASMHELMIRRASGAGLDERRRLADANWPREPERHKPRRD